MLNSYALLTPCKNEGRNLPYLIESIVSQTVQPVLWVVVDDGSTDDTYDILMKAKEKFSWIHVIKTDGIKRDLGMHLAYIMKMGFDYIISYSRKNNINIEYFGNVDGDLRLDLTFFEKLIKEFEKNPLLGIASGGTKHIINSCIVHAKLYGDEPSGGHMLIRKKCFFDCGGIPISCNNDSVLKAKARIKGWETHRFEENIAMEIRDVGSADGYWKGYMHAGHASYFINLHPLHACFKSVAYTIKKRNISGVAFAIGYFSDMIRRKEQIGDNEIRDYFSNKWKYALKRSIYGLKI